MNVFFLGLRDCKRKYGLTPNVSHSMAWVLRHTHPTSWETQHWGHRLRLQCLRGWFILMFRVCDAAHPTTRGTEFVFCSFAGRGLPSSPPAAPGNAGTAEKLRLRDAPPAAATQPRGQGLGSETVL